MVDPLRQGFQQSGWDQAARQAEQSVAESSGQQQRAGGNPVQAAFSWETSPMLHGLLEQYSPRVVQAPVLNTYVFQPDTDLEYIKQNTVNWMALGSKLAKTVSSHFLWTDLNAALERGGPTQFVFDNLARAIRKCPGLRFFADELVSAAGNRLQVVKASGLDILLRHSHQRDLFVFSDSTLYFGQSNSGGHEIHP